MTVSMFLIWKSFSLSTWLIWKPFTCSTCIRKCLHSVNLTLHESQSFYNISCPLRSVHLVRIPTQVARSEWRLGQWPQRRCLNCLLIANLSGLKEALIITHRGWIGIIWARRGFARPQRSASRGSNQAWGISLLERFSQAASPPHSFLPSACS